LFYQVAKQARRLPTSKEVSKQVRSVVIGIQARRSMECDVNRIDGDVCVHNLLSGLLLRRFGRQGPYGACAAPNRSEPFLDQMLDLGGIDIAGDGENRVARMIMLHEEIAHVGHARILDMRQLLADRGPAVWV